VSGADFSFHFHRFHDDHNIAFIDSLPCFDLNFKDVTCKWGVEGFTRCNRRRLRNKFAIFKCYFFKLSPLCYNNVINFTVNFYAVLLCFNSFVVTWLIANRLLFLSLLGTWCSFASIRIITDFNELQTYLWE